MFPSKFKNDSSKSPGLLFIRAYNNWHTHIRNVLRPLDLTHPQFVVLAVTAYLQSHGENVTQIMIANQAEIDTMTTSQIIRLLEKRSLIQRRQHPNDSRAKVILLTDEGREKITKSLPLIEEVDHRFFGSLGKVEKEFISSLEQLSLFRFP